MDGFWGCLRAAGLVAAEEHRRGDMEPKPEKDEDHYTVSGRAMVRPETTNSPEVLPIVQPSVHSALYLVAGTPRECTPRRTPSVLS